MRGVRGSNPLNYQLKEWPPHNSKVMGHFPRTSSFPSLGVVDTESRKANSRGTQAPYSPLQLIHASTPSENSLP